MTQSRALALSLLLLAAAVLSSPAPAAPSLQWIDLYDGGAGATDVGTSALCDPQGNLVVGGVSPDTVAGADMLVRKLARDSGATLWSRRYSSFDNNDMALSQLAWDPEGNVIVGGYICGCVG